ncbi:unnamed protein product [Lathyrus sativus]|nr:unnamed protein product [Lathyrus sativus]
MMTTMILKACIDDIHKIQRKFLWGENTNERKFRVVGWQQVNMSKISEGLGLRKLGIMNKACVARLSWKMQAGCRDLCSEVLRGKYVRNGEDGDMIAKPNYSALWKGMVRVMPELNDYNYWVIGDGKTVDAWSDCCISPGF